MSARHGKSLPPILLGILAGVLALASAFVQAGDGKRLVFLGNQNIAPVVYLDGTAPAGVAVDIVHALAKHLPEPIEIRAMDWSSAQALVAQGKADALIQINETEERRRTYDFSDTLLESQFSIFTASDRVGISGISSLRGLRVGVEAGGLPRQVLEKNPHVSLTIIPNFLDGFKLLNAGDIDAVVVDYRVGSYILAANGLRNVKVSGEPVAYSYSAFAVKKGNTKLLGEINAALKTIKADGTYQQVIDKWRPQEVVFQTREQIAHNAFYAAIAVLLVLFLIAVAWTVTLRNELRKRKLTEEALRESETFLNTLLDAIPIPVFYKDRDGRYIGFNKAYETFFGATRDKLIGKTVFDVSPRELAETYSAKDNALLASGGIQQYESQVMNSHGELRDVVFDKAAFADSHGSTAGLIGAILDITERTQAEKEVRKLNRELEQRVVERTAQLEAANKELEAFSYSVSHDLRTPLSHIDGYLDLLQDKIAATLDEDGRRYVGSILAATKTMDTLIKDLLSFSRMARLEMATAQVDLGAQVQKVIEEVAPDARERVVQWRVADLPVVTGDRAMLRLVLVNLISNALKFTRKRPQAEIEIGCLPDSPAETVIFVRDNGAGFDMKYADRLFGVFQRLHHVDDFEGTGIGLANVRRIVSRHGGRTWAEGKVDGGATFYFSLPRPQET